MRYHAKIIIIRERTAIDQNGKLACLEGSDESFALCSGCLGIEVTSVYAQMPKDVC